MPDDSSGRDLRLTEVHSHDELKNQIGELVEGVWRLRKTEADRRTPLVETLRALVDDLDDRLRTHIADEEREMFPAPESLTTSSRLLLERIVDEHRQLETLVERLQSELDRDESSFSSDRVEAMFVRTRLLRYKFELHSANEKRFFER